jgi:1-deoxy-D-xylulose-5-phosphate synthase
MLYAAYHTNGPVAIRYPRGKGTNSNWDVEFDKNWSIDPRTISSGKDALILSAGTMLEHTKSAVQLLDGKGISCELIDIKRIKPLPIDGIVTLGKQYSHIFCVEDGVIVGGFGSAISEILSCEATRVHILGFPDQIIEQSTRQEAFTEFGLDGGGIAQRVASVIRP